MKNFLLPSEWNCQLNNGGLMFLKDAKIIHYFSREFGEKNYLHYYKLADKTLQQKIKETGVITEEIAKMIQNAKFQLTGVQLVDDKRVAAILKSPLLSALAQLKQSHPSNVFSEKLSKYIKIFVCNIARQIFLLEFFGNQRKSFF